ncbi:MAG TPA: phosphotransferase [Pyrinomonadaceae bacterium]|jgi:aminoglycoside phosphotransferase|nr:phosphotransferase [Pyrinomonadaceae bacterium]
MSAVTPSINLASDALLPQRDLLLDAKRVARLLASQLGTSGPLAIDSCERLRTKYRIGDSLRVLHSIRTGGSDFIVAARAFPEGRSKRAYERALVGTINCGPLRPVMHAAELETVFWTFPNDRKLSRLQSLSSIPKELGQLFVPAWTRSRVVAYAPEKCATAQCLDERLNVLAYAKIYEGNDGQRMFGVYNSLRRSLSSVAGYLHLPRAIAYVEADRMLLLEPVEGERIADLQVPNLLYGYERLGAALAMLHGLPLPEGLPLFKRLKVKRLQQAARIICQARPDIQREAQDLASELTARRESPAEPPVCLHGDVHPKNAVLRSDRLTLIDLDQAGVGAPAADLGSLLASLTYNRLIGLLSPAVAHELAGAFLKGYSSVRELPEQTSLRWHTAAALLAERALRAVNRIRPEGLGCLSELLIEANNILRSGGKG